MVYLREIIKNRKAQLLTKQTLETVAYFAVRDKSQLCSFKTDHFTDEEYLAYKGFLGEVINDGCVLKIRNTKPIKGLSYKTNIYKLVGLYLANPIFKVDIEEKYKNVSLSKKYFLTYFCPELRKDLIFSLVNEENCELKNILKKIILEEAIDKDFSEEIIKLSEGGIEDLMILEDLETKLLKFNYDNKKPEDIIRIILNNFSNSVQKIMSRRKGHSPYELKDEYDVQDILYVIIKSVFPSLIDEDSIAKTGAKNSRIDFILREENILIEVKMIKANDTNEINFIEQLKIDFESYHECPWLKKLFCFVYDPYRKTKDVNNFYRLNGDREKQTHKYNIEIIVAN